MNQFRGKLFDGEETILDDVHGYLGCHDKSDGRKSWYGHIELPSERRTSLVPGVRYRLTLDDGRDGFIFVDVFEGNKEGVPIAEFQVTGGFKEKRSRPHF
jgi:hypothetical protein